VYLGDVRVSAEKGAMTGRIHAVVAGVCTLAVFGFDAEARREPAPQTLPSIQELIGEDTANDTEARSVGEVGQVVMPDVVASAVPVDPTTRILALDADLGDLRQISFGTDRSARVALATPSNSDGPYDAQRVLNFYDGLAIGRARVGQNRATEVERLVREPDEPPRLRSGAGLPHRSHLLRSARREHRRSDRGCGSDHEPRGQQALSEYRVRCDRSGRRASACLPVLLQMRWSARAYGGPKGPSEGSRCRYLAHEGRAARHYRRSNALSRILCEAVLVKTFDPHCFGREAYLLQQ